MVLLNYKNIFKKHKEHGGTLEVMKDNFAFYKDIAKESFKELFKVGANLFANRNLSEILIFPIINRF